MHTRAPREAKPFLAGLAGRLYNPGVMQADISSSGMWIHDPSDAYRVVSSEVNVHKDYGLLDLVARSRFNTDGKDWERRRPLSQPALNNAARPANLAFIEQAFTGAADDVKAGMPLALALQRAALSVFCAAMDIEPAQERLLAWFSDLRDFMGWLQYRSWVTAPAGEMEALKAECARRVGELAAILEADAASRALLARFTAEAGEDPPFDPVGEIAMLMIGGTETTYSSLLWCFDVLGRAAPVQQRLREELARDPQAPGIRLFIMEVLRRFPPIPLITRRLVEDTMLDGRHFAAGSLVAVSIVGLHHHPDKWSDPDTFDPVRPEFAQGTYDRSAWVPFLAGKRTCGGTRLAMAELEQALRTFLPRFEIEQPAELVGFNYSVAMAPATAPRIRLTPC